MLAPIRRGNRRGFTLMEILVVLVIFALSTAIIMPSTSRMLDQATSHAVFFDFQRAVSDLRREANRTGIPLRLVEPANAGNSPLPEGDRSVILREPWRYTLAPDLVIGEGGTCSPATVNLVNADRVVMTLRTSEGNCEFIRQQTTQAQPSLPSFQK